MTGNNNVKGRYQVIFTRLSAFFIKMFSIFVYLLVPPLTRRTRFNVVGFKNSLVLLIHKIITIVLWGIISYHIGDVDFKPEHVYGSYALTEFNKMLREFVIMTSELFSLTFCLFNAVNFGIYLFHVLDKNAESLLKRDDDM